MLTIYIKKCRFAWLMRPNAKVKLQLNPCQRTVGAPVATLSDLIRFCITRELVALDFVLGPVLLAFC